MSLLYTCHYLKARAGGRRRSVLEFRKPESIGHITSCQGIPYRNQM